MGFRWESELALIPKLMGYEGTQVTHTKNTRKEEKGHGQGGTVMLDGTGAPCQIAVPTCLNALTCTVWKKNVFK